MEKKKSYLFLTGFIVLVAALSLQMFQFKVGGNSFHVQKLFE